VGEGLQVGVHRRRGDLRPHDRVGNLVGVVSMGHASLFGGSIFTGAAKGREKDELIGSLQTELRQTQNKLTEASRELSALRADNARLRRNLNMGARVPHGNVEDGYQCGRCNTFLDEEDRYCRECGCAVDWRGWADDRENWMYDLAGDR